ncbi:CinA family protein [Aurantimonas sp. 22II-16-19i]|uniref:CinA family protein n=1 Tax=Aurantimonas sp. 22II-16-19i TaxID=1317114 RepID=UPI0009F7C818|nr:CinA family protein [Aurantimonas sp. 22II-16-19i]ORE88118.1 competence/damage-inducible protein CinA C-terminal domain [Aurantimonas sp. 22II-16-19i]
MTDAMILPPPADLERLLEETLSRACDRKLLLATAESCTGGLLASLLTDVEGASHAFDRGFVTYSEAAKTEILGVGQELLAEKGSVSMEVAVAMAEGALQRSRADIAVSTTGFAGAAGPGDEVGLVWFACARRGGETRHAVMHYGDIGRDPIRAECLRTALVMMREMMP